MQQLQSNFDFAQASSMAKADDLVHKTSNQVQYASTRLPVDNDKESILA